MASISYKAYSERVVNYLKNKCPEIERNIQLITEFSIAFSNIKSTIETDMIIRQIAKSELKMEKYRCLEFLKKKGENKNKFIEIISEFDDI